MPSPKCHYQGCHAGSIFPRAGYEAKTTLLITGTPWAAHRKLGQMISRQNDVESFCRKAFRVLCYLRFLKRLNTDAIFQFVQKDGICVTKVGAGGLEPPTSWSRTKRATKLRYAPWWHRDATFMLRQQQFKLFQSQKVS